MADTVTSQTITDVAGTKTVMKFTNKSDGTGETLVAKMDASELNHASTSTKIARVIYSINTTDLKGPLKYSLTVQQMQPHCFLPVKVQ